MYPTTQQTIILCTIVTIGVSEVSFKNVTIDWFIGENHKTTVIPSSNSFKDNFPDVKSETVLGAVVKSSVPVLYKNAVTDVDDNYQFLLTMANVGLERIEPGAFRNLPQLIDLYLDNNDLTNIDKHTFTDLNLWNLNLENNFIFDLAAGSFENSKIRHLELANNKILKISPGTFVNVSISKLRLSNNEIDGATFTGISGLTLLLLDNNKLVDVALNLPDLKVLDVSYNEIETLRQGDLKNLPKLTELNLAGNKLVKIPEGVFGHTKLIRLKLDDNVISSISPKSFDDMSQLKYLNVSKNNLKLWNNQWLRNTPKLTHLLAANNEIDEIPEEAFKNYPRLQSIELQSNKIKNVSPNAFVKLEKVDFLQLANNEIQKWDGEVLNDVHVRIIDLSHNKLKCIEGDLGEVFKNVEFVHFLGNPWTRHCARKVAQLERAQLKKHSRSTSGRTSRRKNNRG